MSFKNSEFQPNKKNIIEHDDGFFEVQNLLDLSETLMLHRDCLKSTFETFQNIKNGVIVRSEKNEIVFITDKEGNVLYINQVELISERIDIKKLLNFEVVEDNEMNLIVNEEDLYNQFLELPQSLKDNKSIFPENIDFESMKNNNNFKIMTINTCYLYSFLKECNTVDEVTKEVNENFKIHEKQMINTSGERFSLQLTLLFAKQIFEIIKN